MHLSKFRKLSHFVVSLWAAAVLLITGAAPVLAHSVSVGYVVNGANSITVYYGSYHAAPLTPEGIVRLVGPVTLTQAASNVVTTKPAGLIDGTNNFFAGSCSGGSLGTPLNWQSATFTGVPDGQYSIELTGSFSVNWQPCDTSISAGSNRFTFDTTPPTINGLPSNMTVYTPANSNQATATWTGPTATDANIVQSLTSSHAPGSTFPLGATTVTYTAVDNYGNTSTASFTVTVVDNVPPVISDMPANITRSVGSGSTTTVVSWPAPTASDNVGVTSLTSTIASGATFSLGVTTVTYTALDAAGNSTSASFTVTVTDPQAPVITSCPANQTIEATGATGATATWTPPTATDNSGSANLATSHAPGSLFPVGTTTVTYTATDGSGNASTCTFTVTVRDTRAPTFSGVPANVVLEATSPAGAPHSWSAPTATDAVSGTVTVTASTASGSTFPFTAPGPTATTVTFTAADGATPANTASAQFTVTVRDTTPPVIAGLPADLTVEATGPSGAAVTFAAATATDIADPAPVVTHSQNPGSTFPLGTTTVTVTATDASGNQSTGTFRVTVRDSTPPTLAGIPANVSAPATGAGGAVVNYTLPTATDLVTPNVVVQTSHPPGSTFPIGVTTVTFTATDGAGNVVTGSFTVTVSDASAPVFANVPANITVEATGPTGATVNYALPTATDTVDGVRPVTASHGPNSVFALGTTTVTLSASDLATPANTATATFQVTVVDTTPPAIGPVSDITVTAPDTSGAVVAIPLPGATDIVDTAPVVTLGPASGSTFAIGQHTVTVTARDAAGNVSTKTLTVTVLSPAQMTVTPATGLVSTGPQGQQGGPFQPASQTYRVTNNGQVPMTFAINGLPAWASASPASHTLAPSASTDVTIQLSAAADQLAVGTYTGTAAFDNTTSGLGSTTRDVSLTVTNPAALVVTGPATFTATGPQGGSFSPASTTYTLRNTGSSPLAYTVSGVPGWLAVTNGTGTIPPGGTVTVTATVNTAANAMAIGIANGTLSFTNTTNGIGTTTKAVSLDVRDPARLVVSDAEALVATGVVGRMPTPGSKAYTLTNAGGSPLAFTVADDRSWIDIAGGTGTLQPGASTVVTVSINAGAGSMASGRHTGTVSFTNTTNGAGSTTRAVDVTLINSGYVVYRVLTTDGDGVFSFTSGTPALAMSLSTSGGQAQSAPVPVDAGTYQVSVLPPSGFGLTAIRCSDGDSSGDPGARTATINLAASETVTCTFEAANSRRRTTEIITKFMNRRNDMLLSNGPDGGRQIDRLIEASEYFKRRGHQGDGGSGSPGTPNRLGGEATADIGSPALRHSAIESMRLGGKARGAGSFESGAADALPMSPGESKLTGRPGGEDTVESEGSQRFTFSGSLSQMMGLSARREQKKLDSARSALGSSNYDHVEAPTPYFSPLDFWFQGSYTRFTDDHGSSNDDGHFAVLHFGADYIFNPSFLFGLGAQFDSMHMRSADGSDIKGQGWMAGPYTTIRLSEHLFFQGRAAGGKSSNEVSPYLTYTDKFDTTRWLASATLAGRWNFGAWNFTPSASVSYIQDVAKGYTDSLGVDIPSIRTSLGQAKIGPELSYRHVTADGGTIEPRLGLQAIWNFAADASAADFGGTLAGPEGVRGRIEMGLKMRSREGISLDISGSFDGIGSGDYSSVGGKAMVRIPLN